MTTCGKKRRNNFTRAYWNGVILGRALTYDQTIIGKLEEKAKNQTGEEVISKKEAKYKSRICHQGPFNMGAQGAEKSEKEQSPDFS